jgi:hypothetical protein
MPILSIVLLSDGSSLTNALRRFGKFVPISLPESLK